MEKDKYTVKDVLGATMDGFQEGVLVGKREERRKWIDSVRQGELIITMKVRDYDDEVDAIQSIVSFDQIKQSTGKLLTLGMEDMLAQIITAPILKKLIETPTL